MIPQPILTHFQNMKPGTTLDINKAKDPITLIRAAVAYLKQGGDIQINGNYDRILKLTIANPYGQNAA